MHVNDCEAFRQQIGEILIRFDRWMTFIGIIEWTGFALSMIALALLLMQIRKERNFRKGRRKDES